MYNTEMYEENASNEIMFMSYGELQCCAFLKTVYSSQDGTVLPKGRHIRKGVLLRPAR